MIIENFKDDKEALRAMTGELVRYMDRKDDGLPFNLALSGGGTAQKMFALWVDEYKDKIDWDAIRFFGSMNDVFRQLTRTVIMDMQTSFCSSRCIYPPVMCTAFMEKWNLVRKRCVIRVS